VGFLAVFGGTGLLIGGYGWYVQRAAEAGLVGVLAALDRDHPGWRWDDVQDQRAAVPDRDNAALQVRAAADLLPAGYNGAFLDFIVFQVPAPQQLSARQLRPVEAHLAAVRPALEAARNLARLPVGRFPPGPPKIRTTTWLSDAQRLRDLPLGELSALLGYDAAVRAQEGKWDAAVQSIQALFNLVRSLGDEPSICLQQVRMGAGTVGAPLERVLAQGEPSSGVLAALQALLEAEEAEPLLWHAVRGERARLGQIADELRAGTVSASQVLGRGPLAGKLRIGSLDIGEAYFRAASGPPYGHLADLLQFTGRVAEAAQLPPDEQLAELDRLRAALRDRSVPQPSGIAGSGIAYAVETWPALLRRSLAERRCAVVLLAAERFRRSQGRWPASLEELVEAGLLARTPKDPYDRAPLRLRRFADGLVVYSVGADGRDDGGTFDRKHPDMPGTDIGYQLWNVARRRQPAACEPPAEAPAP
jgi:hypothetical protein